ncbi:GntR family transcriptional regulator [Rhodoligotrophos defluvii]|uniref:GntR family transcriptional regulator n=1 Tax=Rhodoligotrophos defluvii TaxID=2561934 RepID=UPI0010C9763B|nr:GntR family transcriptional regulator [Rhodoligotrophos defluvii]
MAKTSDPFIRTDLSSETEGYRTKADWAYLQLRRWIQSNTLQPEERLDQEELAARLGISRVPLRQALVRLQADGLVVGRPHAGATVAPLSLEDAEDVYAARAVMEPMLTEMAVARLADDTIRELEILVERQQQALSKGAFPQLLELDRQFHNRLYAQSGYRTSYQIVQRLRDQSDRYVAIYQGDMERSKTTLAEHREIVRLCAARDAAGASRLMREHVQRGIDYLQRSLTVRPRPESEEATHLETMATRRTK